MIINNGISSGQEYYWKSSNSWIWAGDRRWWDITIEFSGLNGAGGAWLIERWRWCGSSQTMITQPRSLSYEETQKLIREIQYGHFYWEN